MPVRCLFLLPVLCVLATTVGSAQQIPAGTVLPIMASKSLNSAKTRAGDRLAGKLMQDVVLPSGEKIRAGAKVEGTVVESSPAPSARIVVRFDQLVAGDHQYAISVGLRALASMQEVFAAQLPWGTFDDYGTSSSDWNTVQVGGAAVYRGDGTVRSALEVVGHATDYGAVTAKLMPAPKQGCPSNSVETAAEQSLWVFSPWACGTYGFEDLSIGNTGSRSPSVTIDLTSAKAVNVRAGSGWLLVTVVPTQPEASPGSN
jgi:hypothetical protein